MALFSKKYNSRYPVFAIEYNLSINFSLDNFDRILNFIVVCKKVCCVFLLYETGNLFSDNALCSFIP